MTTVRSSSGEPVRVEVGMALRLEAVDSDLLRLLVDSVVDYAIFALDPGGNVATWNPGAERIKGWTRDEIMGRHFSVFYPSDDVSARKPWSTLEQAAALGRAEDEGWRIRKDGSVFWAHVVITALREANGGLVGFAKVTQDLTDRRIAEETGKQFALLEQRDVVAHRLRDGAIRDLFGVGLTLQALSLEAADDRQRGRLEAAVDSVDRVIERLREDVLGGAARARRAQDL